MSEREKTRLGFRLGLGLGHFNLVKDKEVKRKKGEGKWAQSMLVLFWPPGRGNKPRVSE